MDFPWRVKQRRADEHLRRFETDCAEYVETAHVEFRHEADPTTGTLRVTMHADSGPPSSIGATIGDVLHNLRSALDAVAWEACQQAGVDEDDEHHVYFPIDTNPDKWQKTAAHKLPGVTGRPLEIFERQQPWFWDREARNVGVDLDSAARHPLVRLNKMASDDRHRLPHVVLPRAGDTYLSIPTGATAQAFGRSGRVAQPGDTVIEWRVDPPEAVTESHPGGEPILALSKEAAFYRRPALQELQRLRDAVIQATREIEVEALGAVPATDLERLAELHRTFVQAETSLRLMESDDHVIDTDYMRGWSAAHGAEQASRAAYLACWHELFD